MSRTGAASRSGRSTPAVVASAVLKAPRPALAYQVRPSAGAATTPASQRSVPSATPSRSAVSASTGPVTATEVQNCGSPRTKFVVPSSGSMDQRYPDGSAGRVAPYSSPVISSEGR